MDFVVVVVVVVVGIDLVWLLGTRALGLIVRVPVLYIFYNVCILLLLLG
jgi:hypothetical protein